MNSNNELKKFLTCIVQCHVLVEDPVSGQVAGDAGVLAGVRRVVDVQVNDRPVVQPVDSLVLGGEVQHNSVLKEEIFFSFCSQFH